MGKEGGIGVGDNGHPWLFQDGGFAGEGAELGGEDVEVVEAAIVAVGGDSGDGSHCVEVPRGEDKQGSTDAGFKTATLGFPIGTDGLFLQVYQRVAFFQAFVLHQ